MSGLLGKKWPVPIMKPYWPFFAAGALVAYGINSFQNVLMNTDEYKNDPRNPNARNKKEH
ncbi:putative mitochondrial F1F0 ATP synthase subunit Atp18 [Lineolata rhizophorae]|uniref:Putative mitochondrial F1F0 ATP synthase subunit Atp18 n=1 Tax=Lineolata rhizophorae TaxID=578093 RepID=A0A6A6P9X0_9PEZI|nr:putative mitochondrial F1F0 ATP synthase subunit Atp18 [Lineolata rhizophorae]